MHDIINESTAPSGRRRALQLGAGLIAGACLPIGRGAFAQGLQSTEQRIQIVGTLEAYNREQYRRAFIVPLYTAHQGDKSTCVLHQIQSALHYLNRPVISEYGFTQLMGKLENVVLPHAFEAVGLPPAAYHSRASDSDSKPSKIALLPNTEAVRQFGTLAIPYEDLTVTELIERGVNMGHMVLMAVEIHVLHKAFARRYAPDTAAAYTPATGSHAIRILGLQKSSRNTITDALIYDSASPFKKSLKYQIDFNVLLEAYRGGDWKFELRSPVAKVSSYINSGVYLTEARAHPPLLESYTQEQSLGHASYSKEQLRGLFR